MDGGKLACLVNFLLNRILFPLEKEGMKNAEKKYIQLGLERVEVRACR
jgi:hypothetical protein